MLEESNARVNTAEKGGKGLRVLRNGERIRFYLDGLDRRFEVEPIVIEGLNHAVNFGIEFFRQQEVSISCTEKEVKLVTGSKGQERLMKLCSAFGKPFPFMIKDRRVDKENEKYTQILPAVWKAEKREPEVEVNHIDPVKEVVERKLWAAEKITIPAGSAKLVKVISDLDILHVSISGFTSLDLYVSISAFSSLDLYVSISGFSILDLCVSISGFSSLDLYVYISGFISLDLYVSISGFSSLDLYVFISGFSSLDLCVSVYVWVY